MGFSAREERNLESIKEWLTGSDPKLAALLVTFTRLVAGENMPLRERIRADRRAACRPLRRWPPRRGKARRRMGRLGRRLGFQRAALLLWLVVSVVLVTVALVLSRGSGHDGCTTAWATVCTQSTPAHNPGPAAPKKTVFWVHPASG